MIERTKIADIFLPTGIDRQEIYRILTLEIKRLKKDAPRGNEIQIYYVTGSADVK